MTNSGNKTKEGAKAPSLSSGLVFHSLTLENDFLFKNQSFKLDGGGIRRISGANLNKGGETNPNGVGKSRFFSALPEFLLDAPTVGKKKNKNRVGKHTLELSSGGSRYSFIKEFTDGRETMSVIKNGKDLGIRELKESKALLSSLVGLSSSEVYSFLYLYSLRPHPLILGDTSSRRAFFTSFFKQFDVLEHYRSVVEDALTRVKASSIKLKQLEEQKTSLEARLPKEPIRELVKQVAKLEEEFEQYSKDYASIVGATTSRKNYEDNKGKLIELRRAIGLPKVYSEEDISQRIRELKAEARTLLSGINRLEENSNRIKRIKALKIKIAELQEQKLTYSKEKVQELKATLTATQEKLASRKLQLKEARGETDRLEANESKLKAKILSLESKTTGQCPTCGADVAVDKHIKEEYKSARKNLVEVSAELEEKNKTLQRIQEYVKKLSAQEEELEETLHDLSQDRAKAEELVRLKAALEDYLKEVPKDSSDISSKEEGEEKLSAIDTKLDLANKLSYLIKFKEDWLSIPESTKELVDKYSTIDMRAELSRLNTQLAVVNSKKAVALEIKADLDKLNAEIGKLSSLAEEREELELLSKGLSKRGAETILIKSLCSQVQDQINRYARLVLPEDFVFSLDMNTEFSIDVTRIHKGRECTSDVRMLSGAEASIFSIVLLVALLSFVPQNKRPNLLILDEPFATMGGYNRESLIRFLPTLQSIIPDIIIISPHKENDFSNIDHTEWVVQKKGLRSRIVCKTNPAEVVE